MKFSYFLRTIFILLVFEVHLLMAQVPVIEMISKRSSTAGEIVTIAGKGYGNNVNDILVVFGAEKGEILSVTENTIKARVPAGAIHKNISITRLSSGLTAYSGSPFLLSFGGKGASEANFGDQLNFQGDAGIYDLCLCDFDSDGKVDVLTVQDGQSATQLSIFRNVSTGNNTSFVKRSINLGSPTFSLDCSDLDGDGKPDFVATRGGAIGDRAYLYRNISTPGNINFAPPATISNREGNIMKVVIADLDQDGKPELIWTNNTTNKLQVNINNSTPGNFSFSTEMVTVQGANGLRGITVSDINDDRIPEIVVGSFLMSDIFVLPNRSAKGHIEFEDAVRIPLPGNVVEVASADIDDDGKPDIIATLLQDNEVAVIINNTQNGMSFKAPQKFKVNNSPWGIDIGDLNGDGKPDIAVASINNSARAVTLLYNATGSAGTPVFNRVDLPTAERTRNIRIGDLNQDGKPDLCFSSIDSNKLSLFLNHHCVIPVLQPNGEITICEAFPFTITATKALKASYEWYKDGILLEENSSNIFEAASTGTYSVKIKDLYGNCTEEAAVSLNILDSEALEDEPEASNSGPACIGEDVELYAKLIEGYDYLWSGPNNFSSLGQTVVIQNVKEADGGEYFLYLTKNGCITQKTSTFVVVKRFPSVFIISSKGKTICEGESTSLSVNLQGNNEYQWFRNGNMINNALEDSYETDVEGEYHVRITEQECTYNSHTFSLKVLSLPKADFSAEPLMQQNAIKKDENESGISSARMNATKSSGENNFCAGLDILFTNKSIVDANGNVKYTWDFGDGSTSSSIQPIHVYDSPGQYDVSLKAEYEQANCNDTYTFKIRVEENPEVDIVREGKENPCAGDVIILTAVSSAASFKWNTGSTAASIEVKESGTYKVEVNNQGCVAEEEMNVFFSALPDLQINSGSLKIKKGDQVELSATGAIDYIWYPGKTLSDSLISNPVAAPEVTTTYYLIGKTEDGCIDTVGITIEVEDISLVKPRKTFSPNNDGIDDEWYIEDIDKCADCRVSVFDKAGRLVFEAKPYINNDLNSWRGDMKGRPLPEGVYYYIISGNGYRTTGSILLVR